MPYTLLIKGLSATFDEMEVREYIRNMRIRVDILRVRKLGGNKYLVRMSRDSDIKGFIKYDTSSTAGYILKGKKNILKGKKRQVLTQCFNCQCFVHVPSNCSMPYRYVKCGTPHKPSKCELQKKGKIMRVD